MSQAVAILNQVLPIFFLIGLGIAVRSFGILGDSAAESLKLLIVRVVLPAVLFPSFLDMELRPNYFGVFVLVFVLCVAGMWIGAHLLRSAGVSRPYGRFLMGGYEYGMLGISLFAGAYGLDAIRIIAVIALGHEIFIWFVYVSLLLTARDGSAPIAAMAARFLANPVILAILGGIALNLAGVRSVELDALPVLGAVMRTLHFLAPLTVPLVLIIVGHGMRVERNGLGEVLRLVGVRMALQGGLAVIAAFGVLGPVFGLEPRFQVALITLLILPPPFIVPLFMKADEASAGERRFVFKTLTIHTLASLAVFTVLLAVFPTL